MNYSLLSRENRGKPPYERFIQKISPEPNSGCWLWDGCCDKDGYGFIRIGGKNIKAHRFSFEHHKRPLSAEEIVCHACDNPSCVNPDHLDAGDQSRNQREAFSRGGSRLKKRDHLGRFV